MKRSQIILLTQQLRLYWRLSLLLCIILGSLLWMFSLDVIAQDRAYHEFADGRSLLLIPNFLDLISNVPFLVIGLLGFSLCNGIENRASHKEWRIFFIGVGLVSLGSAYYHFEPTNQSLLWDRLPMTLGFMGLFSALMKEYLGKKIGSLVFIPSILLGLVSVFYWYLVDDLRLYYWIQLLPILTLPTVMLLFNSDSLQQKSHQRYLLIALGCYLLAKLTEYFDGAIYLSSLELVSGHTLKHLLAAAACYSILVMLKKRQLALRC
ncbi:ceramidase [Shewanella psychropiezotolerans]|uniref:Ceramidase n=1 Tax=Shewanella psychropiezotolerans TaxID=2593655 RepID=A0ABX5WZA6_9GAMM|nr:MULTISPECIES: ceramidase domain-containing protein [Shewanella]MPY23854.1 ceramidase [Shewanella sp. YLB-07]QDO84151.1 ceramidase [Shewanella psychropiezotolerans]